MLKKKKPDLEHLKTFSKEELIDYIYTLQNSFSDIVGEREGYIESSYDGYWDWQFKDNYEYMSPRFWDIFGIDYRTKRHDPKEWQDIIFPEDLEMCLENLDKHISTKGKFPYRQEVRYRHADGSTVTVLCRGQIVKWDEDGQPVRMIGTHTDITALRKAEESLKKSNKARLNAIHEAAPSGILTTDKDGVITSVNRKIVKIFGYEEKEILGKSVEHLVPETIHKQHKDDVADFAKSGTKRVMANGRDVLGIRKDHTSIPLEIALNRFTLPDGTIQVVASIVDITDRKHDEEEREALIERLTDSNEELERFAYVCSHDLQEPLRMIRSFSEKLQYHIRDKLIDDEKGLRYFKFVTDGAVQAQNLIDDILSYSSIDRDTLRHEEFSAMELVKSAIDNVQVNLEEHSGSITYDELPRLIGNKAQIYQLFLNLINNGLKYHKPNTQPHIHIGVEDHNTHWKFSIQDNGIGMEQRHIKKIFDVFQRLHSRDEYAGTGIGLSICKKVIERHGGKIWVDSEKDKGSTFYFVLPKLN
ncbi:MAG: PAS domain-containing sensor histidine kinase [Methyloligellaceae bacterium]